MVKIPMFDEISIESIESYKNDQNMEISYIS